MFKKEFGHKTQLDAANARADTAENAAAELRQEVEGLKKRLGDQDKDAIVSEFKKSKEYDDAISSAVHRRFLSVGLLLRSILKSIFWLIGIASSTNS